MNVAIFMWTVYGMIKAAQLYDDRGVIFAFFYLGLVFIGQVGLFAIKYKARKD